MWREFSVKAKMVFPLLCGNCFLVFICRGKKHFYGKLIQAQEPFYDFLIEIHFTIASNSRDWNYIKGSLLIVAFLREWNHCGNRMPLKNCSKLPWISLLNVLQSALSTLRVCLCNLISTLGQCVVSGFYFWYFGAAGLSMENPCFLWDFSMPRKEINVWPSPFGLLFCGVTLTSPKGMLVLHIFFRK